MERLKERTFAHGSLEAEASDLLRAAEPHAVPSGLKRRVRERLLEGRAKSWLPLLLRPALTAFGLLIAVGAAAAVGRSVLRRVDHAAAMPGSPVAHVAVVAAQAGATRMPGSPVAAAPAAVAAPQDTVVAGGAAAASDVAAPVAAAVDAHRAALEREARSADVTAQSEATLVYGAAKALRNSGDPALAAKLLDDYAHRYPRGALAEEALALSIDVAMARGDGRAKQLATRYLTRYPHGHFQAKAERVLAQ